MLDFNSMVDIIKQCANESLEAGQPSDFCYGKVTSVNPLKILVEQRLELTSAQLVLTRNVTNYSTTVTMTDWVTENRSGGSGYSLFESHNHDITGTKTLTINNALQIGDEVVLLKKKGGQQFLVIDRVVST